ncbi:hypothetical protein SY26_18955 [Paracoccus sp. 228]|nr:hypothetical protein SY26_18955 [Paracoccus sp. 228]
MKSFRLQSKNLFATTEVGSWQPLLRISKSGLEKLRALEHRITTTQQLKRFLLPIFGLSMA